MQKTEQMFDLNEFFKGYRDRPTKSKCIELYSKNPSLNIVKRIRLHDSFQPLNTR